MGNCFSGAQSQPKGEDAAKGASGPAEKEGAESKANNQKTANGQVDSNHANETALKQTTSSEGTSTGEPKIEPSSSEKETKVTKEVKIVCIVEAKTSEAIVEQPKSDEIAVASTKVISLFLYRAAAVL